MTATLPAGSWFVGCGAMGGAMVAGWRKAGLDLSGLTAVSPSGRRIEGVKVVTELPAVTPRWCWLGFKPQMLGDVAPGLEPHVGEETVVLSILAGVEAASLRRVFPRAKAIVRLMPNLPVSEGEGVTALYSEDADAALRGEVEAMAGALGLAAWCKDEADFGLVGAIAGSGPAYVARFVDALATAAREEGLDGELADAIALQVVAGSGLMARATGETMVALARRVASPGGTTEAGLKVIDEGERLTGLIRDVVEAWRRRSEEMAAAAR
ncbi:pyrroline-5-carboxylate reductase family protein [Sphingomicrobium nitratireducens]|uniref:pyrroline-5-carboxylate reductase family protein n=1 Tax=Sphingomicrobium nitratireducens TaxID=2964666 RepID=UPI00224043BE|nr:pyrroline-5-carboxylate reductase dimerization domain-containing protein [Sphingomicrobium nitratireducens]